MTNLHQSFTTFSDSVIGPLSNLVARIYMGYFIFFISGLAKLDDFAGTVELFEDDWAIPFLPAQAAAFLAMAGELILPILLIAGLFTRLAAAGLLVMAIFIQIWAVQDTQHFLWMIILVLLWGHGGSKISLDNWLFKT